jgi:actin-related protein 5
LVGKVRGKSAYVVGNDIHPDEYAKLNVKTSYERDLPLYMDVQEIIYQDIFTKLGFKDSQKIQHPVLLTESLGTPITVRKQNTELLFEKFNISSLCYGVDSLFSYNHHVKNKNGIILNSGFYSTFVIPYIDGKMDLENTKRISLGGFDSTDFMLRLLQLKYPQHLLSLSVDRVVQMKHKNCVVPQDFITTLRSL